MVVDRYESKCKGAFSELEDDDYVFKKLIGHIIAAGIHYGYQKMIDSKIDRCVIMEWQD